MDWILTETFEDAQNAIAFLKRRKLGFFTFKWIEKNKFSKSDY